MKRSVKIFCLLLCTALLLSTGCIQEKPVLDTTTAPTTEPDIGEIPNIPLEEKTIDGEFYSKEAQVLIATADAYFQRGKWIQYDDTYTDVRKVLLRCPHDSDQEPERANEQNTAYTNCCAWIYNLYWEAFDHDFVAWYCRPLFEMEDIIVYSGTYDINRTDAEWEQICKEMEAVLVPGDCIVTMHRDPESGEDNNGHIILYVGGGKYINSSGKNYNYEECSDGYDEAGTVQYDVLADTYFNPSHRRYLKNENRWVVVRPLRRVTSIPQKSLTRFASMQGIVAQKLTSHPVGYTVNPGDTVSYTVKITNTNAEPVVVEVESTLAENTALFSDEKAEGNVLRWKLAVAAGETREIGYIVKVSDSATPGTVIGEGITTVNGIQVYAGDIHVGKTLTEEQQQKIITAALAMSGESGEMTETIKAVYQDALGIELEFSNDSDMYVSAFSGNRTVVLNHENPMLIKGDKSGDGWYTLYGGRNIKMQKNTPHPEQSITENMLLPGDVILGKRTVDDTDHFVYLVLNSGNLMRMGDSGCEIIGGDMSAPVLDSLLGMHSFVVLRPSLGMK